MQPFTVVEGVAAPLLEDDVNTGAISFAGGERVSLTNPDFGSMFFAGRRKLADGNPDPNFVLNKPQYREPKILVVGSNYGCGSSSEQSVWSPVAFGIRSIIARSFADIYRENCLKNGILPVVLAPAEQERLESVVTALDGSAPITVDLVNQKITAGDSEWEFSIPDGERLALLEGLDDIGLSLKYSDQVTVFEQRIAGEYPWLAKVPSLS